MVFTFLCVTNQAKALTFEGAFDFQMKFAEKKGIGIGDLDKTKKKDFIENKPKEDNNHALESVVVGDNRIKVSDDMGLSRGSISISLRLRQKLKFQKGK